MSSQLQTRVLSAAVLLALFLPAVFAGGVWFGGLIALAAAIATIELARLARGAGHLTTPILPVLMALLAFMVIRWPAQAALVPGMLALMLLGLGMCVLWPAANSITGWALGAAGALYIGLCAGYLAALRELPNGIWWLVMALVPTWIADSGAYFVGRRFGRHKLAPVISPGKTWEGYLGGVVAGALGGAVVGAISPLGVGHGLACGLLVGALGVLGDLAESLFKRQANAKDSGHLIPGHGGVFDRIDSLLWAGVIVYYWSLIAGG